MPIFKQADVDHNETLDAKELRTLINGMFSDNISLDTAKKIMEKMQGGDENDDNTETCSKFEFVKGFFDYWVSHQDSQTSAASQKAHFDDSDQLRDSHAPFDEEQGEGEGEESGEGEDPDDEDDETEEMLGALGMEKEDLNDDEKVPSPEACAAVLTLVCVVAAM